MKKTILAIAAALLIGLSACNKGGEPTHEPELPDLCYQRTLDIFMVQSSNGAKSLKFHKVDTICSTVEYNDIDFDEVHTKGYWGEVYVGGYRLHDYTFVKL